MLNAKELWRDEEHRKIHRMRAMRPVLAGLFQSIKVHAQQNPGSPYFAFEVPSFVFGYPLFDHAEAIDFVKTTFEEQGFQVWNVPPNLLMISWMKPARQTAAKPGIPKPPVDYRPFVYDESAFAYLTWE